MNYKFEYGLIIIVILLVGFSIAYLINIENNLFDDSICKKVGMVRAQGYLGNYGKACGYSDEKYSNLLNQAWSPSGIEYYLICKELTPNWAVEPNINNFKYGNIYYTSCTYDNGLDYREEGYRKVTYYLIDNNRLGREYGN